MICCKGSGRGRGRRGFGFVEILVAAAILGCALVPLLGLVTSGRRTSEFNARRLQAILLCQRIIDRVAVESSVDFDRLPSQPEAKGVIPAAGTPEGEASWYFRAFLGDEVVSAPALQSLVEQLQDNFRVAVRVDPDATSPHLYVVHATVQFRLSPATTTWHTVRLQTLVARRSPF